MNADLGGRIEVPVELVGGPMDGHLDKVRLPQGCGLLDMYLFQGETPEECFRCAYKWANRTTKKGKRWVLEFHCLVSRMRKGVA